MSETPPPPSCPRREYFARRLRVAALLALLLVPVVTGAGLLVAAGFRSFDLTQNELLPDLVRVLGVVLIVFFGVTGLALAPTLVTPAPALTIDDEGLIDGGGALGMSMGRIRFADMRDVRVPRSARGFVGIDLVDVDAFLRGAPVLRRFVVRVNVLTRLPAVTIMAFPLGVRAGDLVEEIQRARAAATETKAPDPT